VVIATISKRAVFAVGFVILCVVILNPVMLKGAGNGLAFVVGSVAAASGVLVQVTLKRVGYLDEAWRFAFLPYWLALWIAVGVAVALALVAIAV